MENQSKFDKFCWNIWNNYYRKNTLINVSEDCCHRTSSSARNNVLNWNVSITFSHNVTNQENGKDLRVFAKIVFAINSNKICYLKSSGWILFVSLFLFSFTFSICVFVWCKPVKKCVDFKDAKNFRNSITEF